MTHSTVTPTQDLALFAATADERWLLGEETFLSTHIPISMRSQRAPATWTDVDLLHSIRQPAGRGNRVFTLYGAAGSGKSELMRWLACMIARHDSARARGLVRLTRTDLGTPALLARLGPLLSRAHEHALWNRRWEALRHAPLALTNAVVWHALGRLGANDAQCLAAGYALRPLVERALGELLAEPFAEPSIPRPFDVVWDSDFQQAARDHPALADIDEAILRLELVRAFDALVLPTPDIVTLLQSVGQSMAEQGIRPLLLIDDLVQALPMHAATILDWATTLDEGHWDIVCGLTPGALHDDARSRILLERITRLDTFDDRMRKLWLSDEAGLVCYALPEERAEHLLRAYLGIYRRMRDPASATSDPDDLWPFTPDIVRRLYRSIPPGKGAPRQLLLHVRDVLAQLNAGATPAMALAVIVPPEATALHPEPLLRQALEVYGVLRRGRLDLPEGIVCRLGLGDHAISARAVPLHRPSTPVSSTDHAAAPEQDPTALALRAWLLGQPANGQALRPLRLGIARLARLSPYGLGVPGAARSPSLRLERTGNGTCPPVCISGIDTADGIRAGRWLGDVAYDLARLSTARGRETSALLRRIMIAPQSARLLWAIGEAATRARAEIDAALGMPLTAFVAYARRLAALAWGASDPPIPLLDQDGEPPLSDASVPLAPGMPLRAQIDSLTTDLFCLRENVWDGPQMAQILAGWTEQSLVQVVLSAHPTSVDAAFRLNGQPLCEVLKAIQEAIATLVEAAADDHEDRACVAAIQGVLSGAVQRDLALAADLCAFLERDFLGVNAAQEALAALQAERLASANALLAAAHADGTDHGNSPTTSMTRRVRRRAILAATLSAHERQALLQLHQVPLLVHSPSPELRASLRDHVQAMLTQRGTRRNSRSSALRRHWTVPEWLRLAALIVDAEMLRLRFDWACYLGILDPAQRRAAAVALHALQSALHRAPMATIEQRYARCAPLILAIAGSIRVPERQLAAEVQRSVPRPPRWLRHLLHTLCSSTAPTLGDLEARVLDRLRTSYPALAVLVAIHFPDHRLANSR